ncbi:hypothetical protein [Silvibacterium dinghuense]|uniref:Response regulatory domain-containing protein n=1 Tax=Silvibacterium dinghuense TaxID=1560006 RepID=A0A4Q1SDN9_9BACT|nr:hypothetical protein [Silvibacterium dinghuense]RXS95207.1 hypothetical protein ESZ00_11425 [Silvibacterium dinghuense]GGH11534.1 hypothetical protein GCM10011586_30290 [Silvibacterium dinghuense]
MRSPLLTLPDDSIERKIQTTGAGNVTGAMTDVVTGRAKPRVVALVPAGAQPQVSRCLEPVVANLMFLRDADEIARINRQSCPFDVLLAPAALLHEHWRLLWRELATGEPHCAILVYSPQADFRLWSEALELGCFDVVVEPLDERLREAVCRAFESTQASDR